ncbi:hypothetical protein RND81_08G023200 [Saponaria officinalis]|uniref:Uncharacterized protein n=1 Tax=Saponaria officinalis TaxID=3572 RepID=A0AAW1J317_SAPOF
MNTTTTKRPPLHDTVSDNFSPKKPKPLNPPPPPPQQPPPTPPFPDLLLNDAVFPDISIDNDELSKLLETPPCPVKFVAYPYISPPVEYSTSYVTINGNEETCGSSFSDTDTSLMASFDTATVDIADPLALWGLACGGGGGGGGDWDWNEYLFGQVCENTNSENFGG